MCDSNNLRWKWVVHFDHALIECGMGHMSLLLIRLFVILSGLIILSILGKMLLLISGFFLLHKIHHLLIMS